MYSWTFTINLHTNRFVFDLLKSFLENNKIHNCQNKNPSYLAISKPKLTMKSRSRLHDPLDTMRSIVEQTTLCESRNIERKNCLSKMRSVPKVLSMTSWTVQWTLMNVSKFLLIGWKTLPIQFHTHKYTHTHTKPFPINPQVHSQTSTDFFVGHLVQ